MGAGQPTGLQSGVAGQNWCLGGSLVGVEELAVVRHCWSFLGCRIHKDVEGLGVEGVSTLVWMVYDGGSEDGGGSGSSGGDGGGGDEQRTVPTVG